jgi:hypothetical protein
MKLSPPGLARHSIRLDIVAPNMPPHAQWLAQAQVLECALGVPDIGEGCEPAENRIWIFRNVEICLPGFTVGEPLRGIGIEPICTETDDADLE